MLLEKQQCVLQRQNEIQTNIFQSKTQQNSVALNDQVMFTCARLAFKDFGYLISVAMRK